MVNNNQQTQLKTTIDSNNSALTTSSNLQKIASNPINSAWVFASAGSGKTKILRDRVLRLLLNNTNPSKILCLTFTKVGAKEMQQRINEELAQWVIVDDEELKKRLMILCDQNITPSLILRARTILIEILDSENKINIQTIHSFCQSLLKIFPIEADVALNFELIEENKSKLLLDNARQEVFKKAQSDKNLQKIISEIFYQINEDTLSNLIFNLLNNKDKLIKNNHLQLDDLKAIIGKILEIDFDQNHQSIIAQCHQEIDQEELKIMLLDLENTGARNLVFKNNIEKFLQSPRLRNFDLFYNAFVNSKDQPRKINGKKHKTNLDEIHQQTKLKYFELVKKYQQKLISLDIYNNSYNLLFILENVLNNYEQIKRSNGYLDYSDLITKTNKLLENKEFSQWVKMKMDGNYDHILIDESQDTNTSQWQIIQALSEDFFTQEFSENKTKSIFIVGDEKQSIYSFQGSEPDISNKIFKYFSQKLGNKLKKIELNNSFRSCSTILQLVDKIFNNPLNAQAIAKASAYQKHCAIRNNQGYFEIWQNINTKDFSATDNQKINDFCNFKISPPSPSDLDFGDAEDDEDSNNSDFENPQNSYILCEIIANKIASWVENKRIIASKDRPLEYQDIMILLRKKNDDFAKTLSKALHRYNIAFSSSLQLNFSDSLIIQDFLAIANFVCLPNDDFNLIHLLKSPFFNLSESQIFAICNEKNQLKTSVYSVVKNYQFFDILLELQNYSQKLKPYDFYYFILNQQQFRNNFLTRFGEDASAIIDKFLAKILELTQDNFIDLQLLLELICKIQPSIIIDSSARNCLKISTIHSAKGLQAPIVIIPDCNHSPNKFDNSKKSIYWLENEHISIPLWCRSGVKNHQLINEINDQNRQLNYEESLRLFYVALTRAEDEIYLASYGNKILEDSWSKIIFDNFHSNEVVKISDLINNLKTNNSQYHSPKNQNFTLRQKLDTKIFLNKKIIDNADEANSTNTSSRQIEGVIIHKILEFLGNNFQQNKLVLTNCCLEIINNNISIDFNKKQQIFNLVKNFINSKQFEEIFCDKIFCEIELNYQRNFVRIDLMRVSKDQILIIDYKSDQQLPIHIPETYKKQLEKYYLIVKNLYPQHNVRCAILWIKHLQLSFLN